MSAPIGQKTTAGTRRWIAAFAGFLLFGVVFALPLCAAMMLCTMPCCHGDERGTNVGTGMPGCATECAVRSDEATPTTVASLLPDSSAHRLTPAIVAVSVLHGAAPPVLPPGGREAVVQRSAESPLHVLNSVFRI